MDKQILVYESNDQVKMEVKTDGETNIYAGGELEEKATVSVAMLKLAKQGLKKLFRIQKAGQAVICRMILLVGIALVSACLSAPKTEPEIALIVGAISTNGAFSAYNSLARAAEREGLVPIIATDLVTDAARDALVTRSAVVMIGGSLSDDDSPRRYTNEVAFIRSACRQGVPVVGFCHGHLAINVALGGTIGLMSTDRANKVIHAGKVRPLSRTCFHEITIEKDSRLYEVVGRERLKVNSFHGCEVKELGEGLRVVARADDGVVEAIEHEQYPVSGFQFHPETIGDMDEVYNRILQKAIRTHRLVFRRESQISQ